MSPIIPGQSGSAMGQSGSAMGQSPEVITTPTGIIYRFTQPTKPIQRSSGVSLGIGDQWKKSDDGTEWFWNGTYWLSTTVNYTGGRRTSGGSAPNFSEATEWDYPQRELVFIRYISYGCSLATAGDTNNYYRISIAAQARFSSLLADVYVSSFKMFVSGANTVTEELVNIVVPKVHPTTGSAFVGLYTNFQAVGSAPTISNVAASIAWSLIHE